jgi:hypothetical protein
MKKIFLIIGLTGLFAAGCNKSLLDTSPEDRYTESNFWVSEQAAQAALTACYATLRHEGIWGGASTPLLEETASPNAYNYGNTMAYNVIAEGLQSATSGGIIAARWKGAYQGIGRCNTFLVKVDEVAELSEETKAYMKAQALFLRAFYYWMLAAYYGDAPLILDAPDKSTQGDLPRTPKEQLFAQILTDLNTAAADLPLKNSAGNQGRATKGAALAMKARVLLFLASPLMNPSGDVSKWQAARDAAKEVMDMAGAAGYGLFENYRALFLPANENNKEVIFDVQFMFPDQGNSFDLIGRQYNSNAPLLDLAEAYEMQATGLSITDPASGYDPTEPYKGRDPRLYATIVYPGDTFMNVPVTPSRFAITGYGMKKYTIYDKGPAPAGQSDLKDGQSETNFIVLRYADVLLMYAEAQNEVSGPDQSVYDAINLVRERVNMPALTPGHTQEELRELIRHERRVEFAGEAQYYTDIRRWKTAEVVLNGPIHKYDGSVIETRHFNPNRDYWWPIAQTELDLNPELQQTPGY